MTKGVIDTNAAKRYVLLVQFWFGGKTIANTSPVTFKFPKQQYRYAAYTSRVDTRLQSAPAPPAGFPPPSVSPKKTGDSIYEPLPTMEVVPGFQSGGVEDEVWRITMPVEKPFDVLPLGHPLADVHVLISEMVPEDPTTLREVFAGRVDVARINPHGKSNHVVLEVVGHKKRLEVSCGIIVNTTCAWTLFDKNCCLEGSDHVRTGTITAISGFNVTIPELNSPVPAPPGGDTTRYWQRGYIEHDGAKISIRDWTAGTDVAVLAELIPDTWVGDDVLLVPGCDKTIETCRARWDNEERFGGFGNAIPAYHPVIETG